MFSTPWYYLIRESLSSRCNYRNVKVISHTVKKHGKDIKISIVCICMHQLDEHEQAKEYDF